MDGHEPHWFLVTSDSNSYFAHIAWISSALKPKAKMLVHDFGFAFDPNGNWTTSTRGRDIIFNRAKFVKHISKIEAVLIQGWQCLQCSRLIKEYETKAAMRYTLCVRIRPDLVIAPQVWP